jgi:hydrogenase maturation protease
VHFVLGSPFAETVKTLLAIGLGNPLMGDEGIGWHVAEWLKDNPRTPAAFEIMQGGTDLLRLSNRIRGRSRVVVIDALQEAGNAGTVRVFEENLGELDDRQPHAHGLSAVQAIRLLQMEAEAPPFTLLAISVTCAAAGVTLSEELEHKTPEILDRVIEELTRLSRDRHGS